MNETQKGAKALIIVEGEKLEPRFFANLKIAFDLSFEIYIVKANIYELYQEMKRNNFMLDIKTVLTEVGKPTTEMLDLLKQKFAYTYLVFDFDAHHTEVYEKDLDLDIDTIVKGNISKLEEMTNYFIDETDPTIGRLYVNYPMMESYRDCDSFFEDAYAGNCVSIDDIAAYKEIVGKRKLASIHLSKYGQEGFSLLSKMNVFKLNKMQTDCWVGMPYNNYVILSAATKILECQANMVIEERAIAVINTALFIVLDHFGNRDGFYDSVVFGVSGKPEEEQQKVLQTV